MKDSEKLVLQVFKTPWAKAQFMLHVLRAHWESIVGPAAAPHSQPYRLEEGVLYIHTDHPTWSAHLMMMQGKLLLQLNRLLAGNPEKEKVPRRITRVKCYLGEMVIPADTPPNEQPFIPKVDEKRRCPICGVPLIGDEPLCSACQRQKVQDIRQKIRRILLEMPWCSYENCRTQVECDKILFTEVKAVLEEWAWNEALQEEAPLDAKAFAVMLAKGWTPDQLEQDQVERMVEKKRKGKQYVPARRK